jgi:hypothetical protein
MATPVPNNKTLIVPGKTDVAAFPRYKDDMRTIEMWAKGVGFIKQINGAGGITITNPTGPIVTVTGSGGGGVTPQLVTLTASCDSNDIPATMLPFGPSDFSVSGDSYWPVWSNTSGATRIHSLGAGWMTDVNAADSVNIFPFVTIPPFTGGPIGVQIIWWAADATLTNVKNYSGFHSFAAPGTYQYVAGDFTLQLTSGADLSLVAGAGTSGVGLVSAAGSIVYWAGVGGRLAVPAGTTFP